MKLALLFYEEGNNKCIEVLDMLEELGVNVATADVYNDENLTLLDQYNVCCVPTVVFFPSYNVYLPEDINKEAFEEEIRNELVL